MYIYECGLVIFCVNIYPSHLRKSLRIKQFKVDYVFISFLLPYLLLHRSFIDVSMFLLYDKMQLFCHLFGDTATGSDNFQIFILGPFVRSQFRVVAATYWFSPQEAILCTKDSLLSSVGSFMLFSKERLNNATACFSLLVVLLR